MITIIISMVIASVVGVAMVNLTTSSTYSQLATSLQDRAYYLADSGARYTIPLVKEDIENSVTTNIDQLNNQTFTLDNGGVVNGQFLIEIDTSDPNNVFVHVTGISGLARSRITYQMALTLSGLFLYGGFGGNDIALKDDARINGDVGTNGASNKIKIQDDAVVTGDQDANVGMTLNSVNFPSGSYISDLTIEDETITLTGGTYDYTSFEMKQNGILRIEGNVTINFNDAITIEENAQIIIEVGASLSIYANDTIEIIDDAEINKDGDPTDMIIYQCKGKKLDITDDAVIFGAIYAPASNSISIENNVQITGGIIGKGMTLQDQAQITYDASLADILIPGSGVLPSLGEPIQYFSS